MIWAAALLAALLPVERLVAPIWRPASSINWRCAVRGRPATWADAVEAARTVAAVYGATLEVSNDQHAPWHPGRCAALHVDGVLVGHAGELHPKVLETLGLPPRTCAVELELDRLPVTEVLGRPEVSAYPPVLLDVALVAATDVPVAAIEAALTEGGGELLEDVRLFDVYTGAQAGEGRRSLAFALRFRAPDRTLTVEEATAARDAAVAWRGSGTGRRCARETARGQAMDDVLTGAEGSVHQPPEARVA